ncbi:GDP-mannose 4,6-dehydratase [Sandaracinobacteroides saxicola]|uniref:GDP-mannose 4,6-dehydratase n=1 Tax=Sandaracinobacteroides saxicola TaxID=2759707 RepID=A0A7G5IKM1_9SPHN|nr:GDP-mannose 4,6-dehydratase [Sandaracinobacteroides saxicola]QMW23913.1 GDP-mannose 4,6-dehydratase [Sandaracinobacteroides saxicola]
MKPVSLIIGATGQDGAYLARLLQARGHDVHGTSRAPETVSTSGLDTLGITLPLHGLDPTSPTAVAALLHHLGPARVFNLGGQSSVGQSFAEPIATLTSIVTATATLLEAIRTAAPAVRFYNAGSSESFGDTGGVPATADTPFRPLSPYGVAKASAAMLVRSYRESYGLFAVTGHLFNHESRLRPPRFVTAKIVHAAARIAAGSKETLSLGDLSIARDWGWAPEYVDAMARMLDQPEPADHVVCTGTSMTLEAFVAYAFDHFGLDWRAHVTTDPTLARPNELRSSRGNPDPAASALNWRATVHTQELVKTLCEGATASLKTAS